MLMVERCYLELLIGSFTEFCEEKYDSLINFINSFLSSNEDDQETADANKVLNEEANEKSYSDILLTDELSD